MRNDEFRILHFSYHSYSFILCRVLLLRDVPSSTILWRSGSRQCGIRHPDLSGHFDFCFLHYSIYGSVLYLPSFVNSTFTIPLPALIWMPRFSAALYFLLKSV